MKITQEIALRSISNPPTSAISYPLLGKNINTELTISGTAIDVSARQGGKITKVEVQIEKSANVTWNGTDFVSGDPTQVSLAGPANRQGRIAADNIFGLSLIHI